MPVVDYDQYKTMLETAYKNKYAYPAFNVTSMETANAVLEGLAEAESDGIIQVTTGGGEFASGNYIKSSAVGAMSIAQHVHFVAKKYNIFVALHTDHCKASKLDSFVMPLIEETEKRRARGESNLFNSHMFDGSDIPLGKNIEIASELIKRCAKNKIILEVEAGVVGGEEDGEDNSNVVNEKLYSTPEDMLRFYEALGKVPDSTYMLAATFGNVHGVYKPGNVKLRPKVLRDGQIALKAKYGDGARYLFVFHGGSGSPKEDIAETLGYGCVKMNVDTDTQYAFTRPIVEHMFKNYDGVLKVEGEVGNKKVYDPRSYLSSAEKGMAKRVIEACNDLKSAGRTLCK